MSAEKRKVAYIDGKPYEIGPNHTSILKFVKSYLGEKKVPTLCDDPNLAPYGACRVCSVEVALEKDGPTKVVASCHTPVGENQHIFTSNDGLQNLRKNIVELVLTDHPMNCDTCEVDKNCELQTVANDLGISDHRYNNPKQHKGTPKDTSHSYMRMNLDNCINCGRCVRACDEIQGSFVLTMSGRGFESRITTDNDMLFGDSSCVSCGACAHTCPTDAISDVFQSKSVKVDKKVRTTCSYCGVGCNLETSVKDGKVVAIDTPKETEVNAGHTCIKGRYAFGFYDHPDRLRSPLIKRNGKFEEVSWDDAYEYIKQKLEKIKNESGPDAIAGISSARCTNEENYVFQKMIRAAIGTNNIDCCARICHSPTAWGMQQTFGTGAATNSTEDIYHADLFLIIGANPTNAHPVTGAKIKQQVMKGKKLIVLDPITTDIAKLADYHIRLRPGTNVAVLNMMLYYIVKGNLLNKDFVENRTEGFDEFLNHINGLDIDHLASVAGVDKQLVKEAAIAYATAKNSMEFHGLGVTEHEQGSKTVMLIADLAMITGNIGRRGVGVNPLRGQNNVQGAADMGCQPHQGAGYFPVADKKIQDFYTEKYGAVHPTKAGLKIPEIFDAAINKEVKGLWIIGEDIVQTDPNSAHVIKAMESLDLLVVQEIFMSETAKLADVVLPGTTFLEKDGTFTNTERRVQRVNKAAEPLPGTKPDGVIVTEMMQKLGYDQPTYDADQVLAEVADVVPFFKGITRERLGKLGLQWPVKEDGTDTKILHEKEFKLGKGRLKSFDWKESTEIKNNIKEYPLILTTSRVLQHYNAATMTRRTKNLNIVDEDILLVNPIDAKERELNNGDIARLYSGRGEVSLKVEVTDKVKEGIVFTTFHFPEHMVNMVTGDGKDEETKCAEYKVSAVQVQKISNKFKTEISPSEKQAEIVRN
ncbi:formate dehydrogenase subunit alpha [Candidatus Pelagibacter sp. RS40]|uniref:formate dehydrogenase subunit alpha n=1 Tax=Candidatus Pelagibacter sp. RS40 TaxID=1977865 RepID=UPI000A14B7F5|nr:formate dehydrogenase subunit alpha [Candidatus Pelagibacter sp. RS40]ARJ48712.1 formate dehydrogenase subunit alpha [Candidatus Pelagibacter sp. RS40]